MGSLRRQSALAWSGGRPVRGAVVWPGRTDEHKQESPAARQQRAFVAHTAAQQPRSPTRLTPPSRLPAPVDSSTPSPARAQHKPQTLACCLAVSPPPPLTGPSPRLLPSSARRHVGDAAHEPGRHQVRGVLRPGAPHGREFPGALRQRLLRRHRLPPQHQGLHDPGRRPHRHRQGWFLHLGNQVRRRVQGVPQAQREGDHVDGQQRAQHQRQPVLHHLRQAASPQRPLHHLRQGHPRLRGARPHGEGADGTRGQAARRDQAQPRHHPRQPARRLNSTELLLPCFAPLNLVAACSVSSTTANVTACESG